MDLTIEVRTMRLLEQALDQPEGARMHWLASRAEPGEVVAKVRRLLEMDDRLTRLDSGVASGVAASTAWRAGDRVGAWELGRELGAGGMGAVYLARRRDGAYEQNVAIKFIRFDPLADRGTRAAMLARFDSERRLLARIEHPNVARVIDGGTTGDGLPYLAMEYVDGVPLTEWCDRHALDVPSRLRLFRKVCDGVQAAHRHLIVHRDLKPQNILVGADGEPRLLDFGIARALDGDASDPARTTTLAMTPAYASPEQVRLEPLTTASDVYSLGVVLFELLSGVRPYSLDGLSPARRERVICDMPPSTLRQALAQPSAAGTHGRARSARVDGDLERIVAKALHKDPPRRYDAASGLADDLRRFLGGHPVLAHPDSRRYRVAKFVGRHRAGTVAAALALAAILAAGGFAAFKAGAAQSAATDLRKVNAFLLDVLDNANPYAAGSEITLSQALDEAAGKVDEYFGDRPDLAVGIRDGLAHSMISRYRHAEAEVQALKARDEAGRIFGADDARTIGTLVTLARLRKDQDRMEEARGLLHEALARLERGRREASDAYAQALNDLGNSHLLTEEFEPALGYFLRALASDRAGHREGGEEHARTLANLAHASRGTGDLDAAEAYYAQAQPVLERVYPRGGPHLAILLNNRARLAMQRGDRRQAIGLQEQAVAMHRRSFQGDHIMVLVPTMNLSRYLVEAGEAERAAPHAEDALAMAQRLAAGKDLDYLVRAHLVLAEARLAQQRAADALALVERATAMAAAPEAALASTRSLLDRLSGQACADASVSGRAFCRDRRAGAETAGRG